MEEFKEKYEDLLKRGYDISFYEKDNFNHFIKRQEKIYYVSFKKNGKELFHFPSRISSKEALLNAYNLVPKVEEFFIRNTSK